MKHAAQREGVRSLDVVEAEATLAAYETAGDSIGIIDDPLPYDLWWSMPIFDATFGGCARVVRAVPDGGLADVDDATNADIARDPNQRISTRTRHVGYGIAQLGLSVLLAPPQPPHTSLRGALARMLAAPLRATVSALRGDGVVDLRFDPIAKLEHAVAVFAAQKQAIDEEAQRANQVTGGSAAAANRVPAGPTISLETIGDAAHSHPHGVMLPICDPEIENCEWFTPTISQ